jgi:hypothetical protein
MIFKQLKSNVAVDDDTFNELYPYQIKQLAKHHWTPVVVAKMAAEYLVERPDTKVMDIGSGAGKFCLIGASCTQGMFYGIEQRGHLIEISKRIASDHDLQNVEFVHSNICNIDFSDYEAFYYYNSFQENLDTSCPIDDVILPYHHLFYFYSNYVKIQLYKAPVGTRLVTYWTDSKEVPNNFRLNRSACNGLLNFWVKVL